MIDSLPVNVRDHEYCPVTVQIASSASLAMNGPRSRTPASGLPALAKIPSMIFLFAAAFMTHLHEVGLEDAGMADAAAFFQSILHMIYIH
jgi:hypothetical protein